MSTDRWIWVALLCVAGSAGVATSCASSPEEKPARAGAVAGGAGTIYVDWDDDDGCYDTRCERLRELEEQCGERSQVVCTDWETLQGCGCDRSRPASPDDCEYSAQFWCRGNLFAPSSWSQTVLAEFRNSGGAGGEGGMGLGGMDLYVRVLHTPEHDLYGEYDCWCNAEAPRGSEDCPSRAQLVCDQYEPFVNCSCSDWAPAEREDCYGSTLYGCRTYEEDPWGCYCDATDDACSHAHAYLDCTGPEPGQGCVCGNAGR